MSVTRSPRDIAFRLSEKSRATSDGRRWEAFTLTGLDAGAGSRGWFDFSNSAGNQLISKYLAARMERAAARSIPVMDHEDDDASPSARRQNHQRDDN
jgi:hypothetical protein